MEIEKARDLGLCFGVRRAVTMLKRAAIQYGRVETLGPVAHNQRLVHQLAEVGVTPVDEPGEATGGVLAISAHGVAPAVLKEVEARGVRVIDTTCPIVRRAQNTARELAEAGYYVIVFGEAEHSEVKGLLGWAGGRGVAALDAAQIKIALSLGREEGLSSGRAAKKKNEGHRVGVISQTTRTWPAFVDFVGRLMRAVPSVIAAEGVLDGRGEGERVGNGGLDELRIVNTLCQTTRRRQEAALELAARSQLMIVIGGRNSANTKRLAELCSSMVETHLVEEASEVEGSWVAGKGRVGVTAGASTPDEVVEETIVRLKSL
jgi:4-hydroxy-3-methylbut-2-enyl diphosphate reductase